MGYHTDFEGEWTIEPPLTPAHRAYLSEFAQTDHVYYDVAKVSKLPDPLRIAVGLPLGEGGCFFTGLQVPGPAFTPEGIELQGRTPRLSEIRADESVGRGHPGGQPGYWCQWVPNADGTELSWDGGDKFYEYVEWIEYLVETFFTPWGYTLSGEVEWFGEDRADHGKIEIIDNNQIIVYHARIEWDVV